MFFMSLQTNFKRSIMNKIIALLIALAAFAHANTSLGDSLLTALETGKHAQFAKQTKHADTADLNATKGLRRRKVGTIMANLFAAEDSLQSTLVNDPFAAEDSLQSQPKVQSQQQDTVIAPVK